MSIVYQKIFSFLKHWICLLIVWTLLRIGFYISNKSSFAEIPEGLLYYLWNGLRFDIAGLCIINVLWTLLFFIPLQWGKKWTLFLCVIFTTVNGIALLFELSDWGYFPYNHKRSTIEVFNVLGNTADFLSIFTSFIKDYWYLFLLAIGLLFSIYKFSKYFNFRALYKIKDRKYAFQSVLFQILILIVIGGLNVIGIRGGLQLKPLSLRDAIRVAPNENVPLVLNTTFSIIATSTESKFERIEWLPPATARNIHPTQFNVDNSKPFIEKNVVFIVMESFSKGFTSLSTFQECTPFLDSIMKQSLTFTNAYSNALHSNQGIPAIVASIPGMMNQAFINSVYANNRITTIANLLKEKGYNTAFYHGATNGSMGLDAFAKNAGYDIYFGRSEYNNEKDYDGNWGIWDEPFLQRTAAELNHLQAPFHALVFNINSHPPYLLPDDKVAMFQHIQGAAINKSIAYADYSFRRFFETISKEDWYQNTIFVFVADHASPVFDDDYVANGLGKFEIPIAIFDPSQHILTAAYNSQLISQIDILPTLMGVLHYDRPFYSLGSNVLQDNAAVLNQNGNAHTFIKNGFRCIFENNDIKALYLHPSDSLGLHNVVHEPSFKNKVDSLQLQYRAMMQVYNNDLLDNKMWTP